MKAEREVTEDSPCCCVIIATDGDEQPCGGFTSGPDEPFCCTCEDRHTELRDGSIVTQRLPEVAS